jgi:hypothetical protein
MHETPNNMEHETISLDRQRKWEEQTDLKARIDKTGIERYFDSFDDLTKREIFHQTDTRVGCMDEGCADCGRRIAGSGILIKDEDRGAFEDNCRRLGVTEITHHEGCGAAGVYAKQIGSDRDPAALAEEFSKKTAAEYGTAESYIPAEEMSRPKEFHATRFAYYDGTGRLNLKNADGRLPNGFVLTRGLYPKTGYAVAEAQLAFEIASGHHGFGELITANEPFEIIVVGSAEDPTMSLEALKKELEPLKADPRIKISGFEISTAALDKEIPLAA